MNVHGSTLSSQLFGVGAGAFIVSINSESVLISTLFLMLTMLSFILSVGFLTRLFLNYQKYGETLRSPLRKFIS